MDQSPIINNSRRNLPPIDMDTELHVSTDQDSVSGVHNPAPERLFRAFTAGEMTTRVDGTMERDMMASQFLSGMRDAGKHTGVVAVHRNLDSGIARQARFHSFKFFTAAMVSKLRGDPNVKYGCYGGTKDEIAEILTHGFASKNEAVRGRVHLSPMSFAVDAVAAREVDEDGLRHVLICRVLMGKSELMPEGFVGNAPSSSEFDSGVDSLMNPRKYIVWSFCMNTHNCPAYVISFTAPRCLKKFVPPARKVFDLNPLLPVLARSLRPEKMAEVYRLRDEYIAKKIGLGDVCRELKRVVGKEAMNSAMESVKPIESACPAAASVNRVFNGRRVMAALVPAAKLAAVEKVLKDYNEKRISAVEMSQKMELVVDKRIVAAGIKLSIPSRCRFMEAAFTRLLPASQAKTVSGLMKDVVAKKISRSEFDGKFKAMVDDKTMDSAVKLAAEGMIPWRSATAVDARLDEEKFLNSPRSLISIMEKSLSAQKMALLNKCLEDLAARKITRDQMIKRHKIIAGSELMASAFKSYREMYNNAQM